ncbi:MAG: AbrB/MazE/SpoVT family DNA-binding domain-containing protein [Phycisphaeraceae bacterium]|nr:MAG: AbrB/MazE/SpoVT family DNA-binding domain-containing protein [Phycisphaeraceae bacterium]
MVAENVTLGRRGVVTIPSHLRRLYNLDEGSLLIIEQRDDGILLRPAVATPVPPEVYTARRQAEFLLNNAVDDKDYARARRECKKLGVDPDTVPHDRPGAMD